MCRADAAPVSVAVKICGVREPAHAAVAADCGAAMVGFVFAASKRQVTPDEAAAVIAGLRAARPAGAPLCVGLFVNEAPATIAAIVAHCGLDLVQLCGDEPPSLEALVTIGRPVIRILRATAESASDLAAAAATWQEAAASADRRAGPLPGPWGSRLLIGLDAPHGGAYGGTGMLADWSAAATLAGRIPVMLAGGLSPTNVAAAIAAVRPWAVDVSSGVETAGAKDPALIRAFTASSRPPAGG